MKKIYFFALGFVSLFSNAQIYTTGFEGYLVNAESYDNGSNGAGDFTFNDLVLGNYYNSSWSSWGGFSISNVTDNTTAGWDNQYASSSGAGRNSESYAVFYWDGFSPDYINTINSKSIDSFYINTTAYSRLSMLDGDAVGKQFGSNLNAQGNDDGTNGEDFLRVWIIVSDNTESQLDSMAFYLADYRFANNNDDYIIADFTKVDLSTIGVYPIQKLKFRFESSDIGQFGINTPTYFAIDEISYHQIMGVEEEELNVAVYPNPAKDKLNIEGEEGALTLRDVNGKVIFSNSHHFLSTVDLSSYDQGIYFLTLENERGKFTQRIIK